MTKAELVDAIAASTELKKYQVELVLEGFIETVTAALAQGETVKLVGFGHFEARRRNARTGRNPVTNEAIAIPAGVSPVFKPGRTLKEAVTKSRGKEA